MKVTTTDEKLFNLVAETDADLEFLTVLDVNRHVFQLGEKQRTPSREVQGGWKTCEMAVILDPASPQNLRTQAGRQVLESLGNLLRLGFAEAARHGAVLPHTTQPQPQEALTPLLEKLDLVLAAVSQMVVKQEAVLKEMCRAHAASVGVGEAIIVTEGGAA